MWYNFYRKLLSRGQNKMSKKSSKNLFEFFRYAIVGGIAALIDMGVLALFKEVVFGGSETVSVLIIATTAGFFAGLAVNFILSRAFVFTSAEQHRQDGGWKGFLLYALVGAIGYGLTVFLMWVGTNITGRAGLWYLLVNCFVKGIVLIWNYIGRKLLVYRGK